jgi:hypothetical protein
VVNTLLAVIPISCISHIFFRSFSQGENTHIYPNALSMYLLRDGKWKIPKPFIKTSFNHRSIEFIFEEVRTIGIFHTLWFHFQRRIKFTYYFYQCQLLMKKKMILLGYTKVCKGFLFFKIYDSYNELDITWLCVWWFVSCICYTRFHTCYYGGNPVY